MEILVGRTQFIDGFWPFLKDEVGRKAVNTGLGGSEQRSWLYSLVRVAQWRWWNLDKNCFQIYGSYLAAARSSV